jgi:hypothetical protein
MIIHTIEKMQPPYTVYPSPSVLSQSKEIPEAAVKINFVSLMLFNNAKAITAESGRSSYQDF